jgi:hypothetical protein
MCREPPFFRGLLAACLALAFATALPAGARPGESPPPRDPDELPPMAPPGGQPRPESLRWTPKDSSPFGERRRLQLTVAPVFAAMRLERVGRPSGARHPIRGGGAGLELDIEVLRPLWVRVLGSYTVHPVADEITRNDADEPVLTAAGGRISVANVGASAVYALDFGRIVPLLDLGLGVLWIQSPEPALRGQQGAQCRPNGICEPGLVCGADDTCQPAPVFELHGGVAIDVLLGARWAVGVGLRYFALLSEPSVFPVYLQASARAGVRF